MYFLVFPNVIISFILLSYFFLQIIKPDSFAPKFLVGWKLNVTKKFRVGGLYTQKTGSSTAGDPHFINSYNEDAHSRKDYQNVSYYLEHEYNTAEGFYNNIIKGNNLGIFYDYIPITT